MKSKQLGKKVNFIAIAVARNTKIIVRHKETSTRNCLEL